MKVISMAQQTQGRRQVFRGLAAATVGTVLTGPLQVLAGANSNCGPCIKDAQCQSKNCDVTTSKCMPRVDVCGTNKPFEYCKGTTLFCCKNQKGKKCRPAE